MAGVRPGTNTTMCCSGAFFLKKSTMELSGETERCGTRVAAAPGRRRRNQQVNVKAWVETIEKFLKAGDDRTIALCRSANVCAFRLLLLKGLDPPASLFSATLCCVLNTLS